MGGAGKRYSAEFILSVKAEVESGKDVGVIAKERGIPVTTIFTWKHRDWKLPRYLGKGAKVEYREDQPAPFKPKLSDTMAQIVREEVRECLKNLSTKDFLQLMVGVAQDYAQLSKAYEIAQAELESTKKVLADWKKRAETVMSQIQDTFRS